MSVRKKLEKSVIRDMGGNNFISPTARLIGKSPFEDIPTDVHWSYIFCRNATLTTEPKVTSDAFSYFDGEVNAYVYTRLNGRTIYLIKDRIAYLITIGIDRVPSQDVHIYR